MKKWVFSSLLMCVLAGFALAQENIATEEQPIVLRAARLLDVTTGKISSPGVVVISGTEIASIDPRELPEHADMCGSWGRDLCYRASSMSTLIGTEIGA